MYNNKLIKLLALFTVLVMCASLFAACTYTDPALLEKEEKYLDAFAKIETGDYEAAYSLFVELGDYKDAKAEAAKFHYVPTKYETEMNYADSEDFETRVITYNENNLPKEVVSTYADGSVHTCVFSYTEAGKLKKIVCTNTDESQDEYECFYDEKGNLVKEVYTYSDGYVFTDVYTYDENGYRATATTTDTEGDYSHYEYSYDANGNMIKIVYEEDGANETINLTYNADNEVVQRVTLDANGKEITVEDHLYNEDGQPTKVTVKEADEVLSTLEYTYNENGDITVVAFTTADGFSYNCTYTYDANGNVGVAHLVRNEVNEEITEGTYKLVYVSIEISEEEWIELLDKTSFW